MATGSGGQLGPDTRSRCARNATARPASSQASDLLPGNHFRVQVPVQPGAKHAVMYSAAAMRDCTFDPVGKGHAEDHAVVRHFRDQPQGSD